SDGSHMRLVNDLRYNLEKAHAMRRLGTPSGRPVVVFTMDQSGAPVAHALRARLDRPVFHVHRLNYGSVSAAEGRCRRTEPTARPHDLWASEFLLRRLPTRDDPWDVVTIVREPVAQAVVAQFPAADRTIDLTRTSLEVLTRTFEDQTDFRNPLRWFDREFEPGLDLCVYDYDFDPVQAHGIIETPEVRVLILRSENLDAAPAALAEFFGQLDPVIIRTDNVARHQMRADISRELAGDELLPRSLLDRAYNSRYTKHFYSADEIARFRRTWEHNRVT
ncbi:MAG TPA: putative capsular polysaccharide synthesis family protein, partial [Acidimicrobiia bacterium]|nr:putative capsular polysaccharide synthesis family protein [Acidimicrobiia bacterium]